MSTYRAVVSVALLIVLTGRSAAAELPKVAKVELQPLAAQVQRLVEALDYLGAPLPEADKQALKLVFDSRANVLTSHPPYFRGFFAVEHQLRKT